MNIVLTETRRSEAELIRKNHSISHYVVHFGSKPPDKQTIKVSGPNVGEHHAKLFFSRGRYWLINLCGLPCAVLKTSGRTVFLTVTEPATDVEVGESFQIGNTIFIIEALVSPEPLPQLHTEASSRCLEKIRSQRTVLEPSGIRRPADPDVWEAALRISSELLGYTTSDELWRRAGDELADTFRSRWKSSPPIELIAAVTPITDSSSASVKLIFSPQPREIPEDCFPAAAEVAIGDHRAIYCRCEHEQPRRTVDLLAGPVVRESETVGAVVLAACWDNPPELAISLDDIFLFDQVVSSLSWALTSLRQRQEAARYARLHDLGTSVLEEKHEHYHLIDRAFWSIDALEKRLCDSDGTTQGANSVVDTDLTHLRYVLEEVRALGRTTLDFMKSAETGKPRVIDPELLKDCRDTVMHILDRGYIEWRIRDDSIKVHTALRLDQPEFLGMPEWIVAAMANLQDNAVNSLPEAGKEDVFISLSAEYQEDTASDGLKYIVLAVADNGPGIPTRLRQKIFRGRIPDSNTGHGVGSRIVRRVMDDHCGLIRLATKTNVGTLVQLWFPRLTGVDPDERKKYLDARRRLGPVTELGIHELEAAVNTPYQELFAST